MNSPAPKKTLIVLTSEFPASESDTTHLPFLQTHLTALQERFPETELIVLTLQYPFFSGRYRWKNIEVISFGGGERSKLKRIMIWSRVWRTLYQLRKEKEIIGLFSLWCTECALLGHYFGRRYHIKHANWLCGQDAKKENKYVKLIRPAPNELVAMSDFLRQEFYRNHRILPGHVIPKGVDMKQFAVTDANRDIDVLGVGSLIPLKQYDVFINTVTSLQQTHPGINSVICGKGPERDRLQSLITARQLHNNILLQGEVSHSSVLQLMQRTKIFAHTSSYEGFSAACLEALAAGASVVSFTKPMDNEIENWHYVKTPEEMTAKIDDLLSAPLAAYHPVVPYSLSTAATQLMALFD